MYDGVLGQLLIKIKIQNQENKVFILFYIFYTVYIDSCQGSGFSNAQKNLPWTPGPLSLLRAHSPRNST